MKLKLASLWSDFFSRVTHSSFSRHTSRVTLSPKMAGQEKPEMKVDVKRNLVCWAFYNLLSLLLPLLWKKIFCVNILSILSLNLSLFLSWFAFWLGDLSSQKALKSKNDFVVCHSFSSKKVILELNLNFLRRFKGWVRLIEIGLGNWKGGHLRCDSGRFFLVIR